MPLAPSRTNGTVCRTLAGLACLALVALACWISPANGQPGSVLEDPQSVLLAPPATPELTFKAAITMVDLGRLDLAKTYLQQLLATDVDDATWLGIRNDFGSATILRLARTVELQPESVQVQELVAAAALRASQDPALLSKTVEGLFGTSRGRAAALSELRALGDRAIPVLLARAAVETDDARLNQLHAACVYVGPEGIPPLIAGLQLSAASAATIAADALGRLNATRALPDLAYFASSDRTPSQLKGAAQDALRRILSAGAAGDYRDNVAGLLAQGARAALRGAAPLELTPEGLVRVWYVTPDEQLVFDDAPPQSGQIHQAVTLSQRALELTPQNKSHAAVHLAALLSDDVLRYGWDQPSPLQEAGTAVWAGEATILDMLTIAQEDSLVPALVRGLEALPLVASGPGLSRWSAAESRLMSLLDHPEPRVQDAALQAIFGLGSIPELAHAPRVVSALGQALLGSSRLLAIVADPNLGRASIVSSQLRSLGYEAIEVRTGREAFEQASLRGDVGLVLLHSNVIRWELSQTVANLRADSRTARLPIGVLVADFVPQQLQVVAEHDHRTQFVEETTNAEFFSRQVKSLLAQSSVTPFSARERDARAQRAAQYLARLQAAHRPEPFDFSTIEPALVQSLADSDLAGALLPVLASIRSSGAQLAIADLVARQDAPLAQRQAAAITIGQHIRRHGLLLSGGEAARLLESVRGEADRHVRVTIEGLAGILTGQPVPAADVLLATPSPANPVLDPRQ